MKSLNYLLSLVLCINLLNCSSVTMDKDYIEIAGEAQNYKAGAAVISNGNKKVYFIDGLEFWNNEIIGKEIVVKGYLVKIETPPQKEGEALKQQVAGIKRIIMKPKIKLINSDK